MLADIKGRLDAMEVEEEEDEKRNASPPKKRRVQEAKKSAAAVENKPDDDGAEDSPWRAITGRRRSRSLSQQQRQNKRDDEDEEGEEEETEPPAKRRRRTSSPKSRSAPKMAKKAQPVAEPSSESEYSSVVVAGGEGDGHRYRLVDPQVGQLLEVRWNTNKLWYSARIMDINADGTLFVRWEGFSSAFNETYSAKDTTRLRPHRGFQSFDDSRRHPDFQEMYQFKKKKMSSLSIGGNDHYVDDAATFERVY